MRERRSLGAAATDYGDDFLASAHIVQLIEGLKANARDAVRCHFGPAATPDVILLHSVRDEVITV